jgi:hypothetical protein
MPEACGNCRSPLGGDETFCGNCGNAVNGSQPQAATATVIGGQARARAAAPPARASANGATAGALTSYIRAADRQMSYRDLGVAQTLDPLSNARFYLMLLRRWLLYAVVAAAVDTVVFLFDIILLLLRAGFGVTGLLSVLSILTGIALFFLFWLLPVPALLGAWSRLLSFQAAAAGTVLAQVQEALSQHGTPGEIGLRTIAPPGEGRREYLELHRTYFTGYITCFAHGLDLYIGWTYWIRISPFRVVLMRIGRFFQNYTGRGNDIFQTLRFESAQASIAALHTCLLEGVDAATGAPREPSGELAGLK